MRWLTAGESHGPGLTLIMEGLPAGCEISITGIDRMLSRRQQGYGRGARMKIERDRVQVISGLRAGRTLGSPLSLFISNLDYENWRDVMDPLEPPKADRRLLCPRPGHADLAGGYKYGLTDLRDIAERASARETATRVAVGAVALQLLTSLDVCIRSRVTAIGTVNDASQEWHEDAIDASPVRCGDAGTTTRMLEAIDEALSAGDSLGGSFQVRVDGLPPGIGSVMHWDQRLDGRIAQALMSIPGIKAVELGEAIRQSQLPGSQAHDQIVWKDGPCRLSNLAGGIEGGMSNGEALVVTAYMKPIPSIGVPQQSYHWLTLEPAAASRERADACAVPAASIVGEAMVAIVLLEALLQQLGGDRWEQVQERWQRLTEGIGR